MFDFGTGELFIIAVVLLLVVGPKHMPEVLRTINGFVKKLRMMARDFQKGLDDLSKEAGMDELKKEMTELNQARNPKSWVKDLGGDEDDWGVDKWGEDEEDDSRLTTSASGPMRPAPSLAKPTEGAAGAGSGPAKGGADTIGPVTTAADAQAKPAIEPQKAANP